jgi:hypothetical protein
VTNDNATFGTRYLTHTSTTTGSAALVVSSTNLTFNPSTGALTAISHVSSSDERLKTNWRPVAENFVDQLATIKSGVYDRVDVTATQAGVSAQSLQKLMPQAIETDEQNMLSVNYGNAALVAAIELAKEVVALKAEIAELKKKQ